MCYFSSFGFAFRTLYMRDLFLVLQSSNISNAECVRTLTVRSETSTEVDKENEAKCKSTSDNELLLISSKSCLQARDVSILKGFEPDK